MQTKVIHPSFENQILQEIWNGISGPTIIFDQNISQQVNLQ